jgi:C4-type Zn-finger protein
MTCPKCGSEDIRSAQRTQWADWFHRARHQRAWRCRKCRLRFYARAEPGTEQPRHQRKRERMRGSKALQRLIVQAIIGVILLFVFYVFLRYLTREPAASSDSGQLIVRPSHPLKLG